MNDKLLKAFIEASGYEITSTPTKLTRERREFLEKENMLLCLAVEENSVDYKVTKKKTQVCFDVDSPEWSCIVDFILNQAGNIEHDIEGYGDLQPMLDYFNRNS